MGDREGEREGDAFVSPATVLLLPGLNSLGLFGVLVRLGECTGERKLGEEGEREAASVLSSSLVGL